MKKSNWWLLIVGTLIMVLGIGGYVMAVEDTFDDEQEGITASDEESADFAGRLYRQVGAETRGGYGRGHMGGGMMGGYYEDIDSEEYDLTEEDAYTAAISYTAENDADLTVGGLVHDDFGYYRFYILDDEDTVGMIMVNGYTGEVWYHSWAEGTGRFGGCHYYESDVAR